MAKTVWLFFLVISVSYAVVSLTKAHPHPKAASVAEASENVESGYDEEDTDFC